MENNGMGEMVRRIVKLEKELRRVESMISRQDFISIPPYANNAAALLGGLAVGDLYTETGTDPRRVCVVT
jgi:hypothetical protein